MNWVLVLVLATGAVDKGTYSVEADCQAAVKAANSQGIKALCVQQQLPEAAVAQMQRLMDQMIKGLDKTSK